MALIPTKVLSEEIEIKKSRFIGYGFPISSPDDARDKLKELKVKYPDSRHVCYAFVWGPSSTHMGMGDDGEPNGTAGRPMLEVVKGSGYENILVAVVRYFGGIKLGTGGLVKAYTEITQLVIKNIEVEEYIEKELFELVVPYPVYESIKKLVAYYKCTLIREDFHTDIVLELEIPKDSVNEITRDITDISKGKLNLRRL